MTPRPSSAEFIEGDLVWVASMNSALGRRPHPIEFTQADICRFA
jgi:hypothetical protein